MASHGGEEKQQPPPITPTGDDSEKSPPFKQFDVVADYSDHHFADSNAANCIGSEVSKKIMREWKMLEKNLPESIFVRAYEERIDLLRAVIIGPAGTPYHDGLFFFDLAFTSDYPTSPPKVYYHSHGPRLNPNLYEDGYVCLSLINTWDGKEEERWNPAISTVLQILLSIQALVLNENPYFNEPGVQEEEEVEMYSDAYNKEAYLYCCKTMMRLAKKPVRNFEEFVTDYFRERGKEILAACKSYSDGRFKVGRFVKKNCTEISDESEDYCTCSSCSSSAGSSPPPLHVSAIFKALLEKTYRDLHAAFTNNNNNAAAAAAADDDGTNSTN